MELLTGRTALVTGAARGIGRDIAAAFVARGAAVAITDVDAAEASRTAVALRAGGGHVTAVPLDVTSETSVAIAFDRVADELGPIDVVVANAGILHLAPVGELSLDAWRRVIDVNLTGTFLTCAEAARRLADIGPTGRIIVSSSLFGLRGGAGNGAYSASKFGVIGLVQSLAAELAGSGVTVNAVCPGQVDTAMMRELIASRASDSSRTETDVIGEMLARVPMGRMATTSDVADTYVWLASDLAGYVTGQSIVVDGGMQVG